MTRTPKLEAMLTHPAAQGLAGGAMGLIPLGRLTGWGQGLFIGIPAIVAAAGGAAWAAASPKPARGRKLCAAGAATALLAGGQWLAIAVDRKMEAWLRKHGVRHPRLVIAAASGVATAAVAVLEGKEREVASGSN